MIERSEDAADVVGVAAKRTIERSEDAADVVGVAAKRTTERSEGAADVVGVAAKRTNLFAELKRRKVFRVAVVYAATAFVILQAADIMLPRLGIPDWVNALIVLLVILGFPIAMLLAIGRYDDFYGELAKQDSYPLQAGLWPNLHAEMRRDPRFIEMMQRFSIVDLWKSLGPPPDCRADGDSFTCGHGHEPLEFDP
jgi:hypothetical protein